MPKTGYIYINVNYYKNDKEEEAGVVCPQVGKVRVAKAFEIIQLMIFGFRALLSIWYLTVKMFGNCYFKKCIYLFNHS